MQLIEAVPNISEGKNRHVIEAVARAAASLPGVRVLHVDSNPDANRTVLTLVGAPDPVVRACEQLIKTAAELIDMRTQHGAHPRLGATDVCPLVALRGLTLAQVAVCAEDLARRVGEKLQIPVYCYEANARTPERKNLAYIRRGEYESLPEKMRVLPPDYGPQTYTQRVAKTGATVIGARNFLLAFNVSLDTQDVTVVKDIAAVLREKNGGLPAVKAIGWYLPAYGCAQVSFNLTDFHTTGLAEVFEATRREAQHRNCRVIGSELIGLIPQEALLDAGRYYAPRAADCNALVNAALSHLQLNTIYPFDPETRIIERML